MCFYRRMGRLALSPDRRRLSWSRKISARLISENYQVTSPVPSMSEASQTETTSNPPAPATPEPAPAAAPTAAIPGPDELLAAAKTEAAANYDRYMRAVAE